MVRRYSAAPVYQTLHDAAAACRSKTMTFRNPGPGGQEANRAFYRLTVLPLAMRIAAELTAWLAPPFGGDLRLGIDLDQVDGLSSEREALWQRVNAATFLSDDEKREAVGYGKRIASSG